MILIRVIRVTTTLIRGVSLKLKPSNVELLFNRKISNCLTQILPIAYALTYFVCTYMLYGLDKVEHLCPSLLSY